MYVTTNATREQSLKAAAAAERAMERHVCCKSQYKFKCFSCGEMINRGDKITKCTPPCWDGMILRFRGADAQNGITNQETAIYVAETGTRTWVHIGCTPCYWDSLPEDSNEYSPPALRPAYTDWNTIYHDEFMKWCGSLPGHEFRSFPLFCHVKGYPYRDPYKNLMKNRIIRAVTRFQAIWRGYLYKQAYPVALLQAQADKMYPPEMQQSVNETIDETFAYANQKWLASGEEGENDGTTGADNDRVKGATADEQRALARERRFARYQELLRTSPKIGDHFEALFNKNEKCEAIYSGEVIEVQYRVHRNTKIKIKYHYDGEVRKYTGKKFKILKKECEEHKKKLGIEAKLTGRLNTARIGRMVFPTPSIQDWRYHYPDGTPVQ